MYFIHIFFIIILIDGRECFIEDTTSIKILEEQKILLRKLQNFQDSKDEAKPLTWNEMLADVLVNRIKIFSFNKKANSDAVKDYSEPTNSKSILTNGFSAILLLYKNCIYDKWVAKYEEPEFTNELTTAEPGIILKSDIPRSNVDGPKGEIEIVEPKYHGKIQEVDSEEDAVNSGCPEGSSKDDKGNCVKEISRLLVRIPSQCPAGYRADRLGNCRTIFI